MKSVKAAEQCTPTPVVLRGQIIGPLAKACAFMFRESEIGAISAESISIRLQVRAGERTKFNSFVQ